MSTDLEVYDHIFQGALVKGVLTPERADEFGRCAVQLRRKAEAEDFRLPPEASEPDGILSPTEPAPKPAITDREFAREMARRLNMLTKDQEIAWDVWKYLLIPSEVSPSVSDKLNLEGALRFMSLINLLIGEKIAGGAKQGWGLLTLEKDGEIGGGPLLHFYVTDEGA